MAGKLVSQAEYAAHRKVSRKTITVWKRGGLLVLTVDGKVDVDASDELLLASGKLLPGATKGNTDDPEPDPTETLEQAADRIVNVEGRAPFSKAEAERIKENYLALLRQLEYDRESGKVVGEYALIRNRFLNIASRVSPRAAVLRSPEEVKALIDEEVALVLEELTLDGIGVGEVHERFVGSS
jgi:hypothetical protein